MSTHNYILIEKYENTFFQLCTLILRAFLNFQRQFPEKYKIYSKLFKDFHMLEDFLVSTYRPVENSKGCHRFLKGSNIKLIKHRIRYKKKNERKIVDIFLPISFDMCFGFSKDPSH